MTRNMKNQFTKRFFQSTPCLAGHVYALMTNRDTYIRDLTFLCESGVFAVVTSGVRARILAALHMLSEHRTLVMLLEHCEPADIAKALALLDRPRKSRQFKHKISKIEGERPHVIRRDAYEDGFDEHSSSSKRKRKHRKVDQYRGRDKGLISELASDAGSCCNNDCGKAHSSTAVKEIIESSSVSGALARKVRRWAKTYLASDSLEFALLAMPPDTWRTIADMVHFSPSDFALPYFLDEVYRDSDSDTSKSEGASQGRTFVVVMKELVRKSGEGNVEMQFRAVAEEFPQVYLNYQFVRLQPNLLSNRSVMELLAKHVPLDTVIWYFEEFFKAAPNSETILMNRLNWDMDDTFKHIAKSKVTTYGKLMERILTFRRMRLLRLADSLVPLAAHRLKELKSYWKKFIKTKSKVAVFGDASSSMYLAIEGATIFSSVVSACFDGELSFFSSKLVESPHKKPVSVEQTLQVCDEVIASGCTSLAAALWPYFDKRIVMDDFILVSDEEENTEYRGYSFSRLLAKYKKHVNKNVTLTVVCVGKGDLKFRADLARNNIVYKVVHIDESRPDLAKFDALLGQLALVSSQLDMTHIDEVRREKDVLEAASKSTDEDFVVL